MIIIEQQNSSYHLSFKQKDLEITSPLETILLLENQQGLCLSEWSISCFKVFQEMILKCVVKHFSIPRKSIVTVSVTQDYPAALTSTARPAEIPMPRRPLQALMQCRQLWLCLMRRVRVCASVSLAGN